MSTWRCRARWTKASIPEPGIEVLMLAGASEAPVLNLLRGLQDDSGLSRVFSCHDLAVGPFISDAMLVMKDRQVVGQASAAQILAAPREH